MNRCQVLGLEIICVIVDWIVLGLCSAMSAGDAVTSGEDNELTLFLEAVKEANRRDDSEHLESEVEVKNACKYKCN